MAIDDSRVETLAHGFIAQFHCCSHVQKNSGRLNRRIVCVDISSILGTNDVQILGCLYQLVGGTVMHHADLQTRRPSML